MNVYHCNYPVSLKEFLEMSKNSKEVEQETTSLDDLLSNFV